MDADLDYRPYAETERITIGAEQPVIPPVIGLAFTLDRQAKWRVIGIDKDGEPL